MKRFLLQIPIFNIVGNLRAALCLIALLGAARGVFAAAFTSEVNLNRIELGDFIELTLKLESDQQLGQNAFADFSPELPNFKIIDRQETLPSYTYSNFNGRVTQSYYTALKLTLQPQRAGEFTIPAFSVTFGGEKLNTQPIRVIVADTGQGAQLTLFKQGLALPAVSRDKNLNQLLRNGLLFLKPELERAEIYLGEVFQLRFYLYAQPKARDAIAGNQFSFNLYQDEPFKSFSIQQQRSPEQTNWEAEQLDGAAYYRTLIYEVNLQPQKLGRQRIEGWGLAGQYQYEAAPGRASRGWPRGFADPFDSFFGSMRAIGFVMPTPDLEVEVLPLPAAGKTEAFTGAVGRFQIDAGLDKTEIRQDDVVTLRVQIQGTGNLPAIQPPKLPALAQFEQYGALKQGKLQQRDELRFTGSVFFEYVLRPLAAGELELPELPFSYFDPRDKTYVTLRTPALHVRVAPVNAAAQQPLVVAPYRGGASQAEAERQAVVLNEDIRHIMTGGFAGRRARAPLVLQAGFWSAQLLPLSLLLVSLFVRGRREKLRGDKGLARRRGAAGAARKRLRQARQMLAQDNSDAFYRSIAASIRGYLSDQFNVAEQGLTVAQLRQSLLERRVDVTLIEHTAQALEFCDQARYAPGGDSGSQMREVYQRSLELIQRLSEAIGA